MICKTIGRRLVVVGLVLLVMSATSLGAAAPSVELVAPGIWRLRCGIPEANVPTRFRSAPVQIDAIKALPQVNDSPIAVDQIAVSVGSRGCTVELPMTPEEKIYGLGLNTTLFDMTGKRDYVVVSDNPENDINTSHAPVPFYVSSRGFGVMADTARFASFYAGDVDPVRQPVEAGSAGNGTSAKGTEDLYRARELRKETMLVDVPVAQGVDLFVFAGPTMLDAVRRYNLFSGGGCVPPMWGLGVAYRGKNTFTADDTLKMAASFRDQHIPCDIWGLEPGWQSQTYSCSFAWNPKTFSDPDAFTKQMQTMGYHLNLWEHAFVHPSSPIHDAIAKYSGNYRVWSGLVPDFSMREARDIFLKLHEEQIFSRGVSGMKLDECDYQPFRAENVWSFPECTAFPSGLDGEQMHSLFGVLYQQTMLEPFTKRNLRTWGLVRSTQALAASLPYVIYSDSYDHKCYVRGMAKSGFCGVLWTPEVRNADSVEEFLRRTETVIVSPFAQIDSWFLKMPPWIQVDRGKNNAGQIMPDHEAVTATTRKLLELRMSLIPYLYSAFNEYHLHGTPPIRAMVLDWPSDPKTALIDDQFMCGPSLLVAPMFKGESSRSVYLPAGDWYDFWTGEKIEGGKTISVAKPIDQIPVYVKSNSLLPVAKPVEHITTDTVFDVAVRVYGDAPEPFTLFDDDGISNDFASGKQNQIRLTWKDNGISQQKSGDYSGPTRYRIRGIAATTQPAN